MLDRKVRNRQDRAKRPYQPSKHNRRPEPRLDLNDPPINLNLNPTEPNEHSHPNQPPNHSLRPNDSIRIESIPAKSNFNECSF